MKILVIDVGGTHVKVLATDQAQHRELVSGPTLTAAQMVDGVKKLTVDWQYDAISIGYPGPIVNGHIVKEPVNLGCGWVAIDFAKAFGKPVKLLNDAAMQALGSYRKGTMLFLGLGAGLGSALIMNGQVEPTELAHLPYKDGYTYEDCVGVRGLERLGEDEWRKTVADIATRFKAALQVDDLVIGGGNSHRLTQPLPAGGRLGDNANAFAGGFAMWTTPAVVATPAANSGPEAQVQAAAHTPIVFLLDVDNTLLDNDRVIAELDRSLQREIGLEEAKRYFEIFEQLRSELGYADYLGALQRYRVANPYQLNLGAISSFLVNYPFANRLFPGALDVLERLDTFGTTVILTDGDVVFQPRKIERSGLFAAVASRVLIYIHKERELDEISKRFPADHYVLVDDKVRILTAFKKKWGARVTTVFPRQGHYAEPSEVSKYPRPDITVERISDLLASSKQSLLDAAKGSS